MRSRFSSAAKAALKKERSPAAMSDKDEKTINGYGGSEDVFAGKTLNTFNRHQSCFFLTFSLLKI
jgi:hypothetical protein